MGKTYGSESYHDEVSDGNKKYVTGEWRKGDPCSKMEKLGLITI